MVLQLPDGRYLVSSDSSTPRAGFVVPASPMEGCWCGEALTSPCRHHRAIAATEGEGPVPLGPASPPLGVRRAMAAALPAEGWSVVALSDLVTHPEAEARDWLYAAGAVEARWVQLLGVRRARLDPIVRQAAVQFGGLPIWRALISSATLAELPSLVDAFGVHFDEDRRGYLLRRWLPTSDAAVTRVGGVTATEDPAVRAGTEILFRYLTTPAVAARYQAEAR